MKIQSDDDDDDGNDDTLLITVMVFDALLAVIGLFLCMRTHCRHMNAANYDEYNSVDDVLKSFQKPHSTLFLMATRLFNNSTMNNTSSPTSAPTQSIVNPTANTAEFMSQLRISAPLCVVIIFTYCIVRRLFPNTFEIKRKLSKKANKNKQNEEMNKFNDVIIDENNNQNEEKSISFPQLSNGYFLWISDIFCMNDETFYIHAGFDALIFRLFLKGCAYICLASLPYSLCVLLPIYATSELKDKASDFLDLISLNSIGPNSSRMYAVVVGVYVLCLIALYYLSKVYLVIAYVTDKYLIDSHSLSDIDSISWLNYKEIMNKSMHLAQRPLGFVGDMLKQSETDKNPSSDNNIDIEMDILSQSQSENQIITLPDIDRYTVMFKDLPKQFRHEQSFKSFMNQLFPNKIAHIIMIPNVNKLDKIHQNIQKHKTMLNKLLKKYEETFNIAQLYNDEQIPQIYKKSKCCGLYGPKKNQIIFHRDCKDALIEKFNQMKQSKFDLTPTAFVIFNSLKEATNCISSPIRFGLQTLKICKAPHPNDINWNNLKFTTSDLLIYNIFVTICMFLLLIFWSIPVGAIQVLANLDKIFEAFGGNAENVFDGRENVATVQGILTVMVLDLWLGLLPLITDILTTIQRKAHRGRQEMVAMTKYFDCLLFMVLLVTVVAGSALNGAQKFADYAKNIVASTSGIINTLANGLSKMSIYFLLYVLLNAFIWLPVELWRPGYFVMDKMNISEANRFRYSVWYAKTMLILTILLTYGVMMPLMNVIGAIYFIFANFVFTYHLSMNWMPEFEVGPKQWPLVFGRLRFSFMISIFTMFGLMALKQAYVCAVLLLPLAGFVWVFMSNLNVKFRTVFRCTSLTSAHSKDQRITKLINNGDENSSNHLGDAEKLKYFYLPPVMSVQYRKVSESEYKPPQI